MATVLPDAGRKCPECSRDPKTYALRSIDAQHDPFYT